VNLEKIPGVNPEKMPDVNTPEKYSWCKPPPKKIPGYATARECP
jgi:hypothetical protein